jgi:hypothetical protein
MVNKKGYLKTIEAVVAILIILGFIYVITPKQHLPKETTPQSVESAEEFVINQALYNSTYRNCIVINDRACIDALVKKNTPLGYNYQFEMCDTSTSCLQKLNIILPIDKSIYSKNVFISQEQGVINPKVFRIYMWEGKVESVISCTDECSIGSKQCTSNISYKTCGNYDSDTCLEWSTVTNCPSDQTCINGQCVTSCTPSCKGKSCGDDGCGGSCGICQSDYKCSNGQCVAKSYGSDVTSTSYAISSGGTALYAFDNNLQTPEWYDSTAVFGRAYIGQNFGAGNTKNIRKVRLIRTWSYTFNAKLQFSDNGNNWEDTNVNVRIPSATNQWYEYPVSDYSAHRYWRFLDIGNNIYMQIGEIEMMELVS